MLVEIALRQLPHLLCRQVNDKNMEPLIVVEAGHALAGVGLVEIASNHHRIAASLGRSRIWRRGNKCDLLAVWGPGNLVAHAWQGTVCSMRLGQKCHLRSFRPHDEQSALVSLMSRKGDPLAVRRPDAASAAVLISPDTHGFLGGQIHDPQLTVRTPGPVTHDDGVHDALPIGGRSHPAHRP